MVEVRCFGLGIRIRMIIIDGPHGIAFEVTANVFDDPFAATFDDPYPYEQRWRTIGMVGSSLIIVVHTWHEYGYVGRIISARMATRYERFIYEEGE